MRRALFALVPIAIVAVRCSTLAENAGGDSNLPSAGVGPFRKLTASEVNGTAPYLLDDPSADYRQPCALAIDASGQDALYVVVAGASGDVIARTRSTDGRTFYGATLDVGHKPEQVLASDQPWEGPDLARPSAIAPTVNGSAAGVWLYYTSNGSVGLAKSADGLTFTKTGAPVLAADATGPIDTASVAQLPDGSFDMMFAVGDSIDEATSADGQTWTRVAGAVLGPSAQVTDLDAGDVPPFDTLRVADPVVLPRITPANRLQIRVLYTGYAQGEGGVTSAIGFAARYGTSGALTRGDGAVYSTGKNESGASLYEYTVASPEAGTFSGSLLYVEQDQSSNGKSYRAIAAGFAPPTMTLPDPSAFPTSP